MGVLLHLSDPHFGTEAPEAVDALLALAARERPDVVVWSGDITQRARPAQFEAARRFHAALRAPHVLAIPGNHDIPLFNVAARALTPYAGFRKAFGSTDDPHLSVPGLMVAGVNTTRAWRHKHGEVSSAQITRAACRVRQAAADQLKVIVVHQPVWVACPQDRINLLRGHAAALSAWADAGVDLVLSGHIHLPSVHPLSLTSADGLPRTVWNVQAGTAVSRRVRGGTGQSVHLIRYQAGAHGRRVIERWDLPPGQRAFERVGRHAL
jgi:3',5'-cyclic AMP phosphodiesterase CpdA